MTTAVDEDPALVTAAEAQRLFGVPLARTARWKYRDLVKVRGYRNGRAVYRPSDLRKLNRAAESDSRSGPRGPRVVFDD